MTETSELMYTRGCFAILVCLLTAAAASSTAQEQQAQPEQHEHMHMDMNSGWSFMQDGMLWVEYNKQGGARGGDEVVAPNWWMGMANRQTSHGAVELRGMFSLDPATVGESGYRELFQVGEELNGAPLIDRQHPHDLFMQLAVLWQVPLGSSTRLTLAGGPSGEAALGPVAFMHRASAADNPTAPLSHHTLDSTHVSFGVASAAVDVERWTFEGSVFNGREPDQNRWDFDFGPLDSVSGRVWFRPNAEWALQVSTGHLVQPEALEPGNVERTTASVSWTRLDASRLSAVTVAYGRNDTDHGARQAFLIEGAHAAGAMSLYSRLEIVQEETELLLSDTVPEGALAGVTDPVLAFTVGGVREVFRAAGVQGGLGADVTLYGVPASLRSAYGDHPVSFHVFFRLRPSAPPSGRMWNMRMTAPRSPAHHME